MKTINVDPTKEKLILKVNMIVKADLLQNIAKDVREQFNTGVVVIPQFIDVLIVPKDTEIEIKEKELCRN